MAAMPGLYRVQWNQFAQATALPALLWVLPWPQPLALVGMVLPHLVMAINLAMIAFIKCPACTKRLMIKGLAVFPRRKCPHCRDVVA
jgi:hypothetical protein